MDLLNEKGITAPDLIRLWIPILRRTTLDDVGDVDLVPLEVDGLKDLGQELSSSSNKWPSLNVLVISRTFPDDHQFRLLVPFSEHECASGSVEFTSSAVAELLPDFP